MNQNPATNAAAARYRPPAIGLHWLIALLIFGGFGLGHFMHDLPASPDKLRYYSWHKWIGVTVFLLALLRAGWRMTHTPPPLPAGAKAWERLAAHGTHALLYLLMFAIPLSGWLHSSASGYQTVYLGLLPIPDLLGKNAELADRLADLHGALNLALLGLLFLHVAAAIQHHFLKRDDIVRRMVPRAGGTGWAVLVMLAGALFVGTMATLIALEPDEDEHEHHHEQAAANGTAPVAAGGELSAEFRQMGVGVSGSFTAFKATALQFDPADLASAHAEISVDTGSFDIGDADYNAEVRKPEWFDSTAFPQATFVSEAVTKTGDGQFQATGKLTIKGKTGPVTVPFTVGEEGGKNVYAGTAKILRSTYGIGDKSWDDTLEDGVTVHFKLIVAKP